MLVSRVCIKKWKPENLPRYMSRWGPVHLLLSVFFFYVEKKFKTPSLLRIEEEQEVAVFREVVSFTPDPMPGKKVRGGARHRVHIHSEGFRAGPPTPWLKCSLSDCQSVTNNPILATASSSCPSSGQSDTMTRTPPAPSAFTCHPWKNSWRGHPMWRTALTWPWRPPRVGSPL